MESLLNYFFDEDIYKKYLSMTQRSAEAYSEASKYNPGGVHSSYRWFPPYPFYVKKGMGSRIWDIDGNEYIDYVMGYGALIAGHAPRPIIEGILEVIQDGTLFTMPYELQIKLVKEILRRYPWMDAVRISNTGTEAVTHAIKIARIATGREGVIKIEGGYHGGYDAVKVSEYVRPGEWGPPERPRSVLAPGVPRATAETTYIVRFNDMESLENVLAEHGDEVACMIMEPIMMNNVGLIPPEKGYLERVGRLLREYGVIWILDEVKTGFRVAYGGASELYNVRPDIVVVAKALGGGVPISAVIMNSMVRGVVYPEGRYAFAGTYNGNVIGVAGAYANLTRILSPEAYRRLDRIGSIMGEGLAEIIDRLGLPLTVSYVGSAGAVHFMDRQPRDFRDVMTNYDFTSYRRFWSMLMVEGVLIRGPPDGEPYFLSLAHSEEDIQTTLEKTEKVLNELVDRGYLKP